MQLVLNALHWLVEFTGATVLTVVGVSCITGFLSGLSEGLAKDTSKEEDHYFCCKKCKWYQPMPNRKSGFCIGREKITRTYEKYICDYFTMDTPPDNIIEFKRKDK